MTRALRLALAAVCLTLVALLLYMNVRGVGVPDPASHRAQLRFLDSSIDRGAASDMQRLFPEGLVFTHVLRGLACVALARTQPAESQRLLDQALESLAALESEEARRPFASSTPPLDGVFLLGWRSRLRAHLIELLPAGDSKVRQIQSLRAECDAIATAIDRSASPFLCAYPDQSWPVDTVVAVASLRAHDRILGQPQYDRLISEWIENAKAHADPSTGLLPHFTDPHSGHAIDGPRGSSQSVINAFLPEIDSEWATTHYRAFRDRYVSSLLGVPGVREYRAGISGVGDIDSGPLIFGLSASASVVSIAAASANGDFELARELSRGAELCGLPLSWAGRKRYALGVVPVGDAFLVWARSTPARKISTGPWPSVAKPWAFHGLSLGVAVILTLAAVRVTRRHPRHAHTTSPSS